jgi:hypothetical protein
VKNLHFSEPTGPTSWLRRLGKLGLASTGWLIGLVRRRISFGGTDGRGEKSVNPIATGNRPRRRGPMQLLHCGTCGGLIQDRSKVSYRLPRSDDDGPIDSNRRCVCSVPIVYGPPMGFASIPRMPRVSRPPTEPRTKG